MPMKKMLKIRHLTLIFEEPANNWSKPPPLSLKGSKVCLRNNFETITSDCLHCFHKGHSVNMGYTLLLAYLVSSISGIMSIVVIVNIDHIVPVDPRDRWFPLAGYQSCVFDGDKAIFTWYRSDVALEPGNPLPPLLLAFSSTEEPELYQEAKRTFKDVNVVLMERNQDAFKALPMKQMLKIRHLTLIFGENG
ncbi:hypothetical protein BDZ45DRAFT_746883 [Acephala macrosclerotiorum]|nr:hypothetical protein BDZ45DRAFT_746883 [Acephala macrosclerotiorum]